MTRDVLKGMVEFVVFVLLFVTMTATIYVADGLFR